MLMEYQLPNLWGFFLLTSHHTVSHAGYITWGSGPVEMLDRMLLLLIHSVSVNFRRGLHPQNGAFLLAGLQRESVKELQMVALTVAAPLPELHHDFVKLGVNE